MEIEDQEYAVYTAVCRTVRFRWDAPGLTFADYTGVPQERRSWSLGPDSRFTARNLMPYSRICKEFEHKNLVPARLEKRFQAGTGFQFVSEREANPSDNSRSYFRLSRVGFTADKRLALVYLCWFGGPLAAQGILFLLERTADEWQILGEQTQWVS